MSYLQNYMQGEILQRIVRQWSEVAGETVTLEVMEEDIFAYGTELACLRLEHHFKSGVCETDVGYSKKLNTWHFLQKKVYSKP